MMLFEPLFQALNEAQARYVVVGGVATVLHGYARLTADIDLLVDLEPAEARRVIEVLVGLGYQPQVPVQAEDFADPATRRRWMEEKGMQVFSMWDPSNPMRTVDLFVNHPIGFEDVWQRSEIVQLTTTWVRIASIEDLIRLKQISGRAQDLTDIEQLQKIQARKGGSDG
jgi:hypothetical protein